MSYGTTSAQEGIGLRLPEIQMDSLAQIGSASDLDLLSLTTDSTSVINYTANTQSIMTMPKAYDFHQLGMFCKFDVYLDKGSKIPLRFRLGTVGGVDELERKGPTRYNY